MDDVAFSEALIRYMTAHYPVDPSRVYLSGFSNGSSQAMVTAMVHPGLVAAICPIDGNWPGERIGPSEVDYEQIKPMALARRIQEKKDYRMPVWYTYGTREPSYPVYRGCTQQHQYDFWKWYNHVEVRPTPPIEEPHPCGCGVEGDQVEEGQKSAWRDEIMELQEEIIFDQNEEMIGRKLWVMVEGKVDGEDAYVGRTYRDAPEIDGYIFVNTEEALMTGDFIRVRVTGAYEYDLIGEVIG